MSTSRDPAKSRPLSANVKRLMRLSRAAPENAKVIKVAWQFTAQDYAYCNKQGQLFMEAASMGLAMEDFAPRFMNSQLAGVFDVSFAAAKGMENDELSNLLRIPLLLKSPEAIVEALYWIDDIISRAGDGQNKSLLLSRLSDPTFRVSDAVSLLGYSESYFRKVCRRTLGCTPVEYFTRLRVEHAKQLLKQYRGIRNIAEIAENSGFTDPYYFSRKFRQVTGMSPREYSASASENILLSAEVSLDETDDPEYLLRHRRHS